MSTTIAPSSNALQLLRGLVRDVPDFPKPGITYKDITPLLGSRRGLAATVDLLVSAHANQQIDVVVGIESRGFIFGAALAKALGAGFVPARKPGKLPTETICQDYALEYGNDSLEMHKDAFDAGERVLVCDDLIATGGTARAAGQLVEKLGGKLVGYSFVIELAFLGGREKLNGKATNVLLSYK